MLYLKAVKCILHYRKGTQDHGLRLLSHSISNLYGFSDADWAGCPFMRQSSIGFYIYLGSNCVSWCSKKQPTISQSSTEAEYHSMAYATAEITWLAYLLRNIGVPLHQPPQLFCDNISSLHLAVNPCFMLV